MNLLLAVGIGIGLAAVAGVRAYLPLALVGIFARFGLFELPAPFGFLDDWVAIGALVVLAILETGLDKVPSLERVVNIVQMPLRIAAGAVLFALALREGLDAGAIPEFVAGGVIAGLVAVLKYALRPSPDRSTAGVSSSFLSTFEDAVALVGGIIAALVPLLPVALVAFLLYFYFRIRRRRGKRFGGLRILGD